MSIKISFKKTNLGKISSNLVLFVDEKFNIKLIQKYISNQEFTYISDLFKTIISFFLYKFLSYAKSSDLIFL